MKIVWLTDMTIQGSGYKNLSVPMCEGLVAAGHEVWVLGLQYQMEEHFYPFHLIPTSLDPNIIVAQVSNLVQLYDFDVFICALDIPLQKRISEILNNIQERRFKYFAVTAVESIPLTRTWAAALSQMDKVFVISEFGAQAALEMGVNASHIPVGIDTVSWRVPSDDERKMLRSSYGLAKDTFTILTVADNQERKFLSRTAQIIRDFKDKYKTDVRWILVTRVHAQIGWILSDLIADMRLINEYLPFERGLSFKELWSLYAISDVFLLTSRAEGLGMPALEAMSCGVPVVATNCTGLEETMRKGSGYPIEPEKFEDYCIDPFGNSRRYFASVESGVQQLGNVWEGQNVDVVKRQARAYAETLKWENAVNLLDIHIKGDVLDG